MEDGPPAFDPAELARVAEGASRSGIVWVRPPGTDRYRLAWHVWHEGAVLVVSGGGEQDLPPLEGVVEVVIPSKETRARLVTVLARPRTLAPGTAEWMLAVAALSAKRLNDRDPAGQRDRWAQSSAVVRLEPVRIERAGPGTADSPSGALPPPLEGSTTGRRPWHWHGRPRVRRGFRRRRGDDETGARTGDDAAATAETTDAKDTTDANVSRGDTVAEPSADAKPSNGDMRGDRTDETKGPDGGSRQVDADSAP